MQSGKIKHYDTDKGYGFITAPHHNEDVFFHISQWKPDQPPVIGQQVYFDSKRNAKNQLRATTVTTSSLSIESLSPTSIRTQDHSKRKHTRTNKPRKSWVSTIFSGLIFIAIAFFGYSELAPQPKSYDTSQTAPLHSITGDQHIDNTIALIQQDGPYPYPNKDGSIFYNRESKLPKKNKGYYREYTVPTPKVSHRGARRIVTGGKPPKVYYLTVDHYESFTQLEVN